MSTCVQKHNNKAIRNFHNRHLMASVDIRPRRFIDTHTLNLVELDDTTVLSYAILSHRWLHGEEVVNHEYLHPFGKTLSKSGYQKIQAVCRQARQDNLRYVWVDTCCIEQGNHNDVAANITSMYAYYQNAEVCYAYLVDVPQTRRFPEDSRWFGRGWTLQELLAPRTVIFFDKNWVRIGDKQSLQQDISRRTAIPPGVLSGEQSISDVNVLDRMSWAFWRTTTRPQDGAYCLQGLLGVSIEPDYCEDMIGTFNRLGKAVFDAHPELKEKLGVGDDLFHRSNENFYGLLKDKLIGVFRTL
ncbi:HET-domain-containing protein [Dendrothele bispora CBS 962.96]|uniref:HET-domain-containing protein n=1 Tax=Dendrothele bispora (strain CBS 962.96) TaxID=1314807 RepID=A0A4S8MF65_DENBC|nr:HET-domain-containing protein [Dendrothele bispora CBS 962.96]